MPRQPAIAPARGRWTRLSSDPGRGRFPLSSPQLSATPLCRVCRRKHRLHLLLLFLLRHSPFSSSNSSSRRSSSSSSNLGLLWQPACACRWPGRGWQEQAGAAAEDETCERRPGNRWSPRLGTRAAGSTARATMGGNPVSGGSRAPRVEGPLQPGSLSTPGGARLFLPCCFYPRSGEDLQVFWGGLGGLQPQQLEINGQPRVGGN